jgi:hypothetical protein
VFHVCFTLFEDTPIGVRSPARAASILAMSIFFIVIIASIARLAAAVSGSLIASINARGANLPAQSEPVPAPPAHAFLAAARNDRIPVAVGFLLRVGEHLERDRLVESEFGAAVQTRQNADRAR